MNWTLVKKKTVKVQLFHSKTMTFRPDHTFPWGWK